MMLGSSSIIIFYSQLNCSCYSYPSKPRLQWLQVFRLHIYGVSKWLLTQITHAHTATTRVCAHSACISYVLYAYLYCVYAPVGGAISISVSVTSLCQQIARCLP